MKFVDMFSGIGTIRMGMEQAGHECVYSIEWDKWKRKIYKIIFGNEPEGRDICEVRATDIPRADIWCFGFPCQDISVAGHQLGFDGERSSLFFEVMRLLSEIKEKDRPKYLLIENVKNLFSVNKGWDFFNLLYTLDEVGYDAEWQLLNSKNFGVPQNRERVFIIGHLRGGGGTRKVFPIGRSNTKTTLRQVIPGSDAQRVYDSSGLARTLKAEGGGQGAKTGLYFVDLTKGHPKITSHARCLQARYNKGYSNRKGENSGVLEVRAVLTPEREKKKQNGRRIKNPGEPMFTLTTQDKHGIAILQSPRGKNKGGLHEIAPTLTKNSYEHNNHLISDYRIRRLTPKECWRLQGVSDEITDMVIDGGISDTQMYRGAGDACTVNVVYAIAKQL